MGRHGENIRHRKSDGRWEGRYKEYHKERGEYVYRSVYGHTYDEVKEKISSHKMAKERHTANNSVLFSQAADEWLEHIKEKCKYSTYVKYSTVYRIHLSGILGNCPLTEISDIRLYSDIPEHLSEPTKKNIYSITNQILRYANSHYWIQVPVLTRMNSKNEKKSVETLSIAEQAKLFDCLYTDMNKYKIAVSFSLYLGLRLGELCALKWTDIDFINMTMTINHTVQRIAVADESVRTNLLETGPKSDCSKRILPVSRDILQMLDNIHNNQPYVFGGKKPLEPRTMQYQFKRILKEATISDRNFHILRHTFATNCVEKGIDVKSLSELLGHSDVKITLNRYVHPTMATKRLQLEQLFKFYDEIHGQTI